MSIVFTGNAGSEENCIAIKGKDWDSRDYKATKSLAFGRPHKSQGKVPALLSLEKKKKSQGRGYVRSSTTGEGSTLHKRIGG